MRYVYLICFGIISMLSCVPLLSHAQVIISEILWSGTAVSTADEWLELQMLPTFELPLVSISDWKVQYINSQGIVQTMLTFPTGTYITAAKPFLIANYDQLHSHYMVSADIVTTNVNLLNSALYIWLQDANGTIIDTIGSKTVAPFAGGKKNDIFLSMQRTNALLSGTDKSSWQDATEKIGVVDTENVMATPGFFTSEEQALRQSSSIYSVSTSSQEFEGSTLSMSSTSSIFFDFSTVSSGESIVSISFSSEDSAEGLAYESSSPISSLESSGSAIVSLEVISESSSAYSSIVSMPRLQISEVLPNPVGADTSEWIEIKNTGEVPISMFDIAIQIDATSPIQLRTRLAELYVGSVPPIVLPGALFLIKKEEVLFTLPNTKGSITLLLSGAVLDTFTYTNTIEGVSWGKDETGIVREFCQPTPGELNTIVPPLLTYTVQSTNGIQSDSMLFTATDLFTINIELHIEHSTINQALCRLTFSDGYESTSCNPPSHTVVTSGSGEIAVQVTDYCGTTVEQKIEFYVSKSSNSKSNSVQNKTNTLQSNACEPSVLTGIELSEILPDPLEFETEGEWVELHNKNPYEVTLCNWYIDDGEKGSKAFSLQNYTMAANGYLVLPRTQTKLAFNNTNETVRLLAPVAFEKVSELHIIDETSYIKTIPGEVFAKKPDGTWHWSPFKTSGEPNQFRSQERTLARSSLIISAALPRPDAQCADCEWIEIQNVGQSMELLQGMKVTTQSLKKAPYILPGIQLAPGEVFRITNKESHIGLTNTSDVVMLLDANGYIVSALSWRNAKAGFIYRADPLPVVELKAHVLKIIDPTTYEIEWENIQNADRLPLEVRRQFFGASNKFSSVFIIKPVGIQAFESALLHSAHLQDIVPTFIHDSLLYKEIVIRVDPILSIQENRLQGYIYVDGELWQSTLLQHGYVHANSFQVHPLAAYFKALETEAKKGEIGAFLHPESILLFDSYQVAAALEYEVQTNGIEVKAKPESSRVQPNTLFTVKASPAVPLYISVNSGAFIPFSGSYLLTEPVHIAVYGALEVQTESGAEIYTNTIQSNTTYRDFLLEEESYSLQVQITEVFASPETNQDEWIELFNPTETAISIGGWKLDDEINAGSKPFTIPITDVLKPNEVKIYPKSVTKLSLNNSGDQVSLLSPDEKSIMTVIVPKTKKGESVMYNYSALPVKGIHMRVQPHCVSSIPSPAIKGRCIQLVKAKDSLDADNDLLPDDFETWVHHTNPVVADSDGDSLSDAFEIFAKLEPLVATITNRDIDLLYKKFIQKHTSATFKVYKTKPSVLQGKAEGIKSVAVLLPNGTRTVATIKDAKWNIPLTTLPAGAATVLIEFTDTASKTSVKVLHILVPALNKKTSAKSNKTIQNFIPTWAKFKQTFVLDALNSHISYNESESALNEQFTANIHTINLADSVRSLRQNIATIAVVLCVFFSGALVYLKKHAV